MHKHIKKMESGQWKTRETHQSGVYSWIKKNLLLRKNMLIILKFLYQIPESIPKVDIILLILIYRDLYEHRFMKMSWQALPETKDKRHAFSNFLTGRYTTCRTHCNINCDSGNRIDSGISEGSSNAKIRTNLNTIRSIDHLDLPLWISPVSCQVFKHKLNAGRNI